MDGTLVDTAGLTGEAFDVAVAHVLGRHPGPHDVAMSGKTDPLIVAEILAFAGVDEEEAERHVPSVIDRLEAELASGAEAMVRKGRVLPGVEAALQRLHGHPAVVQSVLTGNTVANATVKLRTFGLDRWLDLAVGAFGSDNRDRDLLVPLALDRVRRLRGHAMAPEAVWVVGDTPRDLACARAGGARCVLVATGRFSLEELRGTGADRVMADLSCTDDLVELLLS